MCILNIRQCDKVVLCKSIQPRVSLVGSTPMICGLFSLVVYTIPKEK